MLRALFGYASHVVSRAAIYLRSGDFSLLSLLLHPRVLVNHLRYHLQLGRKQEVLTAWPTDLDLEATNLCNQNCIQCYRHQVKPYNPGQLSLERFRTILDQFPYVTSLALNGFGEPLLNKELPAMIRYARQGRPYLRVTFHTNGEFLTPATCDELVAAGLTRISISTDAGSKEAFDRIRLQGKWERVIAGVKNIVAAREKAGRRTPRVGMSYSIMAENAGDLPEFIKLAAELGCDNIGPVRLVSSKWGYRPVVNRKALIEELRRAHEVAAGTRLERYGMVGPDDVDSWLDSQFSDKYAAGGGFACPVYWSVDPTVHLSWDGHYLLCCERPYPEEVNLGNVLQTPFAELWNSPTVVATRRRFYNREQPSAACEGCGWLTARDKVLVDDAPAPVQIDRTPRDWIRIQKPLQSRRPEREPGLVVPPK